MLSDDVFCDQGQVRALCIRCGADKHQPFHRCEVCGFEPTGGDLAKSAYLSVYRFADDHDRAERYSRELTDMQVALQGGASVSYEQAELAWLQDAYGSQQWSGKYPFPVAVLLLLATLLWRPALVILGLFAAVYFLKV